MIKFQPKRTWLLIALSFIGLWITTWLALRGRLVLGEENILSFVYGLPEDLRLFFLIVTLLGSAWILAIVLIVLLIKERFDVALRVMVSGLTSYLIVGIAKELVGRGRPGELLNIIQRELFVMGYGFPSGHTALATSIAVILGAYLPRKRRYIVPLWILFVGISRLYLGVHAPLDIIGGFCIGLLVALCVLLILPPHKNVKGIRVAKKRKRA